MEMINSEMHGDLDKVKKLKKRSQVEITHR